MDKIIQQLYDFTPMSGERVKSIAYENGYAIATNKDICVLHKYDYDSLLEGKSISQWGNETPHINLEQITSTTKTFDPSLDDRWYVNISDANGFYWTVKQGKRPIEQLIVEFGGMRVPYERTMKIFEFMKSFDINIIYNTDKYLYCMNESALGFTTYYNTENDGIVLKTTRLVKFPKLEE